MRVFSAVILFLIFLFGCSHKNAYEKEIALLDSTKIVLQVKLNELRKAEVNIDHTSFEKFEVYSEFLKNNLRDTIGRNEANSLRNFVTSGKTISSFINGKQNLIKETETSILQLQKLSSDLKEDHLSPNTAQTYFTNEKTHAEQLINSIEQNLRSLNVALINFRNSVPRTEELIKHINNGQLPTVIADTVSE